VDVAADRLDARIGRDGAYQRFPNTAKGVGALAAFCHRHGAGLAVMEATGGYEKRAFALLWAAGVQAAIVNPRSVRRFAEAMGRLEKTDRIDAGVIAWYGEAKRIAPQRPAGKAQQALAAAVTHLRQLTDQRTGLRNQARLVEDAEVRASIGKLLAAVACQIRLFEKRVASLIDADPLWRELSAAFRTTKGVAGRTVARVLAEMPEVGTLSHKAAGKLAGLAPLAHDSGRRQGKRVVRGGRAGVRSILFVVASGVRRYNPDFAAFHQRLAAAGKPKKVIRVALAHKLLIRLNAKARDVRARLAEA
jgi:transposase